MSNKLEDKIKAILNEGSGVPGTDALLGTKQSEELKKSEEETSGDSKTSKMVSGYDKSTKQPKLDDVSGTGEKDEKASSETAKIKEKLQPGSQGKLKEEAMTALFSGEELSEEFQQKAKAIFEAAVSEAAEVMAEERIAALEEEYQLKLDEAVEEVKGELVEQIDGYLDYVVEEWMQDNAIALESGIKVEVMESFMSSMKKVFETHYIEIPEDKVDIVQEQADRISEMEAQLVEAQELAEQAATEAQILRLEAVIAEESEGLTAIQSEKLYSLAENIEFDTEEEFASKLKVVKESFFKQSGSEEVEQSQVTPASKIEESKTHSDVEAVLKALRQDKKLI